MYTLGDAQKIANRVAREGACVELTRWIPGAAGVRYPRCMIDTRAIRMRWEADGSKRDERGQRLFAASEARAAGWEASRRWQRSPESRANALSPA